jgi:hypothetical protein
MTCGYRRHAALPVCLLLCAGTLLSGSPSRTKSGTQPGSDAIVIEHTTVLHGTGGPRLDDVTVVIENGRFSFVGPVSALLKPARPADARGGFLIPGLIDQHAHVTIRPMVAAGQVALRMDAALTREVLETLLRFGITTVRNPEAPIPDGVDVREHVRSGRWQGPDVQTAGPALAGGYTAASIREAVQRQAAAGVEWVKLGSALPPDVLRSAVDEARTHGLRTVGHLQRTTWTQAARAGIDAITHGAPWSPEYLPADRRAGYVQTVRGRLDWLDLTSESVQEMIRELRNRRIPVDPTLVAYDTKFRGDDPRYLQSPDLQWVPRRILQDWRSWTFTSDWSAADYTRGHRVWPRVLGLAQALWRGGVRLTVGSDFPNPWVVPGASLHTELELLASAGIPPGDVLAMATTHGAAALGLEHEIGRIVAGRRANAVWLSADPTVDIRNTRAIRGVLKDGRWVHRAR